MLPLDVLLHALELVATFAVGEWTGHQRCRVAFAVSTEELRQALLPPAQGNVLGTQRERTEERAVRSLTG